MQKKYILGVITLSACITLTQVMPAFAGIIGHSSASYYSAQQEAQAVQPQSNEFKPVFRRSTMKFPTFQIFSKLFNFIQFF